MIIITYSYNAEGFKYEELITTVGINIFGGFSFYNIKQLNFRLYNL